MLISPIQSFFLGDFIFFFLPHLVLWCSPSSPLSSQMARLYGSVLSTSHCEVVASAMTSNPSHLRELSLRENQSLTDADVKLLSSAMMHPNCRLETLRLWDCSLSEISCDSLASALRSNPSHLRVLDLGGNQLKDPAVKLLCGALQDPLCELETLRDTGGRNAEVSPAQLGRWSRNHQLRRSSARGSGGEP
ncbi:ribonuclease inhibitor-like isoform X2 [Takifugu flavidus]|uniref:ribonuclease inhibitor-like isoform X2 n=1 Tax=Takifugu flavidus TaxID=433684 RepID=UPI002544C237|nr:ribonuclease inhibitor-like isoform X2 [Takifugu flavidus]